MPWMCGFRSWAGDYRSSAEIIKTVPQTLHNKHSTPVKKDFNATLREVASIQLKLRRLVLWLVRDLRVCTVRRWVWNWPGKVYERTGNHGWRRGVLEVWRGRVSVSNRSAQAATSASEPAPLPYHKNENKSVADGGSDQVAEVRLSGNCFLPSWFFVLAFCLLSSHFSTFSVSQFYFIIIIQSISGDHKRYLIIIKNIFKTILDTDIFR